MDWQGVRRLNVAAAPFLILGKSFFAFLAYYGYFWILVLLSFGLYILALYFLSIAAIERYRLETAALKANESRSELFQRSFVRTQITGLLAGLYTLALPLAFPYMDALANCLIRVVCFFYGCKLLDLTVARASHPPILVDHKNEAYYGLDAWQVRRRYLWLLFSETRYASFDIAVNEGRRRQLSTGSNWAPALLLSLTVVFPFAELKVISAIIIIRWGLETCHTILHLNCEKPLFWYPFSSSGISEFWASRWHQGAQPFLHNLGYAPARAIVASCFGKSAGRAAGVLGTFSLSGIWHGWCATALVHRQDAWRVGIGLWIAFVLQGVGCLVENMIWKDKDQGGWPRKLVTLGFAVEVGAIWMRDAEPKANVPWLM